MKSQPLFVVPCSATKSRILHSQPMPAREAYTGQAFQTARRLCERHHIKWCVLSGYYGFLWPNTPVEFYDQKMLPVTPDTVWDDCFGSITNRQYGRLRTASRVIVLGSRLYATAAATLLARPVESPLAGLPIGKMLSTLIAAKFLTDL